jgi:hypothetical protein
LAPYQAAGTLDCHNVDSALTSLAGLLSVDERGLKAALMDLSPTAFEASLRHAGQRSSTVLWDRIVGKGTPPPLPAIIHWFHATRVLPGTDFCEGIQPLVARLPIIESFLATLETQISCEPLPQDSSPRFWREQGGFQYSLKTESSAHWGPFAFLVRDAIVQRCSLTHDYLGCPEIVEDLAGIMVGENAPRLIDQFRRMTRPCIVKFRSSEPRDDVAEVALLYCYSTLWGQRQGISTNTCFDAGGQAIPSTDIVGIEYLNCA